MDNMEYIDDYFNGVPTEEQKTQFEERIIHDISFAEEVAFYISAKEAIKDQLHQEKKLRLRNMYEHPPKVIPFAVRPRNKWVRYLVAACIVAAVMLLTWFIPGNHTSPQQLADNYISQNLQTMGVTMGNTDSLQTGLNLYNSGKFADAAAQFETILSNDPANFSAKKYAGIAFLRMESYDKALYYFTSLESDTFLYSNPGGFYKAITLLKRNNPGDIEAVKKLLSEIISENREGKEDAELILKKLS